MSAPAAKAKRKRPLSTFDQSGEKKEKNGFCFENHFGDTFIVPPKEENNIITTVIPYSHPQAIPEVIKNTNCMSLKFASIEDKDNYTSKLIA